MKKVKDILDAKGYEIYPIHPDITVYEAVRVMGEKNTSGVLVLENGALVGILTEKDYARKIVLQGKRSVDTKVREIMTANLITVTLGETVKNCMEIMAEKHIRHLPVVEAGRLVGIISIGDVMRALVEMQKETIEHLTNYLYAQ